MIGIRYTFLRILAFAVLVLVGVAVLRGRRGVLTPEERARRRRRRSITLAVFAGTVFFLAGLWAFGTVSAVGGFGDPRFVPAVVRIRVPGRFHDVDAAVPVEFDYGFDGDFPEEMAAFFGDVTLVIRLLPIGYGDLEGTLLYEEKLTDFYDASSACSFSSFGYFTYNYRFERTLSLPIDFTDALDRGYVTLGLVFAPGEDGFAEEETSIGCAITYFIGPGGTIRFYGPIESVLLR